jgi:hypothetical protein
MTCDTGFDKLTQTDSILHVYHTNSNWLGYFLFIFLSNFIISYLIGWKLNYIIFSAHEKWFISQVIVIFLKTFHLIKIKSAYLTNQGYNQREEFSFLFKTCLRLLNIIFYDKKGTYNVTGLVILYIKLKDLSVSLCILHNEITISPWTNINNLLW